MVAHVEDTMPKEQCFENIIIKESAFFSMTPTSDTEDHHN